MQLKNLFLLLAVSLLFAVPAMATAATPVTSCMVINSPGVYVLKHDLKNMDPGPDGICLDVQAAATIDGRGHKLDGIGTGTGISIHGMDVADGAVVRNLVLTDWDSGIGVTSAFGVKITKCTLKNNDYAIGAADGGITVRGSIIQGSEYGIFCEPMSGCNVYGSQIKDNAWGIRMWDNTLGTIANNYLRNTNNVDLQGMPESTACNTPLTHARNIIGGTWCGGNYWASPMGDGYSETCLDADRNGICDQAYDLGGGYMDNFPLTGRVRGKIGK